MCIGILVYLKTIFVIRSIVKGENEKHLFIAANDKLMDVKYKLRMCRLRDRRSSLRTYFSTEALSSIVCDSNARIYNSTS